MRIKFLIVSIGFIFAQQLVKEVTDEQDLKSGDSGALAYLQKYGQAVPVNST